MGKKLPIFLGFFLSAIAVWTLITSNAYIRSTLARLDDLGYDLQLKAHLLTDKQTPSPKIVVVDIDDKSLQAEGRWPWARSTLATLVDQLYHQGAAVVAFDMFFSEKEPNLIDQLIDKIKFTKDIDQNVIDALKVNASIFDEDKKFAASLENITSILAIGFLPRKQMQNTLPYPLMKLNAKQEKELDIPRARGYIVSIPLLQEAAGLGGFINIFPDTDGILRHAPLVLRYQSSVYPSLALQAVLAYTGSRVKLITPQYADTEELEAVEVGNYQIPTDITGQALIPFIGFSYTFPYYSATDVIHKRVPKNVLKDKIVFVGTSATGLGDLKATAVQSPYPGVEIQASMANGILKQNFSYRPAWVFGANLLLTILFGIITSIAFPFFGPRLLGTVALLLPISMFVLNDYIWKKTGLVLSFLVPISLVSLSAVLNMLWGYLFETRKREQIKNMFGQYVPEGHIDEMLQETSDYALKGEDRDMSVLFADIRSFTTISEGLTAKQLVDLLNTFFTPMTKVIFDNRGTIDKYVGDLIMAFWGAPLADDKHAENAIESAISMQEQVVALRPTLKENNWPDINIGIGINSGTMSVGDMGSQYRRNYTVLGDNVNLGSRVEGLTKFYGANIMVTEATRKNQTKFIFRKLDRVRVKGKKRGVEIYDVLGRALDLTPELEQELNEYHKGLDLYFEQKWDDALAIMQALNDKYPDKKVYELYISRIKEYKEHPVSADWDGVFTHTSK